MFYRGRGGAMCVVWKVLWRARVVHFDTARIQIHVSAAGASAQTFPPHFPPTTPPHNPRPTAHMQHNPQYRPPSDHRARPGWAAVARVWAAAGQRSGPHTHTHVWAAPDGPAASAERGGPAALGEAALSRAAALPRPLCWKQAPSGLGQPTGQRGGAQARTFGQRRPVR